MFIEFIDQLRCTSDHEESWLVASFLERNERFIIRGTLGCYICSRQFPIERGIALFGDVGGHTPVNTSTETVLAEASGVTGEKTTATPADSDAVMRLAAFLGAAERSTFVVAGEWALSAHSLSHLFPMRIFALNPTQEIGDSEYVGILESSEGIPLSAYSVNGVALDAKTATPANLRSAVRVLRPTGRLLAPCSVEAPPGVTVIAQDNDLWVAEKTADLITLRR